MDERHRHPEVLVHLAKLPDVGELARSGHVTDGRKERVLHEGAEQDVRAEPLGRLRELFLEILRAERRLAGHELVALAPDRRAGSGRRLDAEEREAISLRRDLG